MSNKNNREIHDLARCGACGDLVFLHYIHRDDCSPTGWICDKCVLADKEYFSVLAQLRERGLNK